MNQRFLCDVGGWGEGPDDLSNDGLAALTLARPTLKQLTLIRTHTGTLVLLVTQFLLCE